MNRSQVLLSIVLAIVILIALSLPVFGHEGHGKGEVAPYDLDTPRKVSPETAAHIGLQTAEVDFGPVEEVLRLVGVVKPLPNSIAAITPRIAGTVLKITVQVGETVQRGDLIAEINSPEFAQIIYEARKLDTEYFELLGEVAGAVSKVEALSVRVEASAKHASIVKAEYERLQTNDGAIAINVLSEKQVAAVQADSEAKLREIEQSLAEQQLESMNKQVESMQDSRDALREIIALIRDGAVETRIAGAGEVNLMMGGSSDEQPRRIGLVRLYAPISGVVIARTVNAGEGIEAGRTLVEVADYSRVQIEGELPESLVERLAAATNNKVRLRRISDTDGDTIATGRVRFISPVIDPIKRTTHLFVEADNPQGLLRDGMYVDLSIVLREETSAVVVPVSAVVIDGPMHFVFVKDGEFYKKQDINPGYRDDRFVEVLEGVLPGDIVVTRGAYSLTQLRPKVETLAEAAAENDSAGRPTDDAG